MHASRSGFASAMSRRAAGITQSYYSRIERGREPASTLETLCACAAALNVQLAAFVEAMPGADLPRDIEHLRRQNLVVATAQAGGWTAIPEATLDEGRWSRSIDVLLSRAARREAAVVEIWDLLLDGGEAMRGLAAKVQALRARLGPAVARAGPARRARNAPEPRPRPRAATLFAARYPASSAGVAASADRTRHADAARRLGVRAGPAWMALDCRRDRAPLTLRGDPTAHATLDRVDVAVAVGKQVRPRVTLSLLSVQHALIHGQSALYPLVYLAVIDEFGVSAASIVILSTIGSISSGFLQYGFAALTRRFRRRTLLGSGGLDHGGGDRGPGVRRVVPAVRRLQHRLEDRRVAPAPRRQRAPRRAVPGRRRIGSAIAVHVAGGNIGTVFVGFAAALTIGLIGWRGAVLALGSVAVVVAIAILIAVREAPPSEADRTAAETPVRHLYRKVLVDRDLRWVYAAAVLGGGSRGLGVLNIFVPLYLAEAVGLDAGTIGLMYGVLLAASVPGPLVAGWLSDRVGRKPVIIGVYLGGAASIALFVLAGQNIVWLWAGIIALSLFSFVESPQLQALLADVTPRPPPRRRVQHLLRAGVRGRVDVGHRVRRGHRRGRAGRPGRRARDGVLADGAGLDPGRARDAEDPHPEGRGTYATAASDRNRPRSLTGSRTRGLRRWHGRWASGSRPAAVSGTRAELAFLRRT